MVPSIQRAARRALLPSLLLLLEIGLQAQEPPGAQREPIPVGINLRPITPFDRGLAFADVMQSASGWTYSDLGPLPFAVRMGRPGRELPPEDTVPEGPDGWPLPEEGRAVSCLFLVGMRGQFPSGDYVVTWTGEGKLTFQNHAGIVSEAPHRLVVRLDSVSGGQPGLELSEVDPADPIRDIHVWLPGLADGKHLFNPCFLDRLRPFSVLRFYPWMRIYTSSGRWSERTTPDSARQSGAQGVAVEHMVALCNELAADPWFCMPHTADDEYVRAFATCVRDTLRGEARVYVEFSNETWNTDFVVGRWAREEAKQRKLPAMRVVAERAARVFDIWREVFGQQSGRIVRVAAGQLHNPGVARALTKGLDGNLDALAVGAYFATRADRDPVDARSDAGALMAAARANLENIVLPRIEEHHELARTLARELGRPIPLITYEGGQSIVARSPGGGLGVEATLQCQRSPEMFRAYRDLIEGAQARGLELFVAYDFVGSRSEADTFSVLESLEEPASSAVKYRALVQGWESRGQ